MTRRQRMPYVVVLGVSAAALIATGVGRMVYGFGELPWWLAMGGPMLGVPLGAAAIMLHLHRPSPSVPYWARPFSILKTPRGVVVRCEDCDDVVIVGSLAALPVPRILTYIHTHYDSITCRQRQRSMAESSRKMKPKEPSALRSSDDTTREVGDE